MTPPPPVARPERPPPPSLHPTRLHPPPFLALQAWGTSGAKRARSAAAPGASLPRRAGRPSRWARFGPARQRAGQRSPPPVKKGTYIKSDPGFPAQLLFRFGAISLQKVLRGGGKDKADVGRGRPGPESQGAPHPPAAVSGRTLEAQVSPFPSFRSPPGTLSAAPQP